MISINDLRFNTVFLLFNEIKISKIYNFLVFIKISTGPSQLSNKRQLTSLKLHYCLLLSTLEFISLAEENLSMIDTLKLTVKIKLLLIKSRGKVICWEICFAFPASLNYIARNIIFNDLSVTTFKVNLFHVLAPVQLLSCAD